MPKIINLSTYYSKKQEIIDALNSDDTDKPLSAKQGKALQTQINGKANSDHTHSQYEESSNKVSSWSSTTKDTNYPSEKLVKDSLDSKSNNGHTHSQYLTSHQSIAGKEETANKVSSWSSTTTDTHYPSEKLVKDSLDNKSKVSFTQTKTSGIEIGTINIDGTDTKIYQQDNNTTYTAASATPNMDGTGAVGTSVKYAREDHTHPADTSKTVTLSKLTTATTGYVATYEIKQGGTSLGKIDIPKDYLVKSGSVKTVSTANSPVSGYVVGDKYIDFVINTKTSDGTDEHIYVNTKDLLDDATQSRSGLMSASDKTKLDGITTGANAYTHPSGTAKTGNPTANQTPGFGGNFTVTQFTSNSTGHISGATDRTITLPSLGTTATTAAAGNDSRLSDSRVPKFTDIGASSSNEKDLNTYRTGGFYYISSDANSKYINNCPLPKASNLSFFLLVETWGASNNNYVKQTLTYCTNNKTYTRTKTGNSDANTNWSKWKLLGNSTEYIVGTQTSSTSTWTGTSSNIHSLESGQVIYYKLPYASTSTAVTLNLTLADGTTTGAKEVWFWSGSRVTTNYGVNSVIGLVYNGSQWWVINPSNNNNNYYLVNGDYLTTGEALTTQNLIACKKTDKKYYKINTLKNTIVDISRPILLANGSVNANTNTNNVAIYHPWVNPTHLNGETELILSSTVYQPVYLEGTGYSNGEFTVSSTPITQTLSNGKFYIMLGVAYATNGMGVDLTNQQVFHYENDRLVPIAETRESGGTNLLLNSQNFGNVTNGALTGDSYKGCKVRRYNNTSGTTYLDCQWGSTPTVGEFAGGDTFTLSFWAKGTGSIICYSYGSSGYMTTKPIKASEGATYSSVFGDGNCSFTLTSDWKRYYVTWLLHPTSTATNVAKTLTIRALKGADAYYAGPMLERGEVAHDWSPAPNDKVDATDSRLSNTRTPTDGTVTTAKIVDKAVTDAKLANYEYINGTQASATSAWTGVTTKLTSTTIPSGTIIYYRLNQNPSTTNVTLELTLSSDNTKTTGAKAVYMDDRRVTNHFRLGSVIPLRFDGTNWIVIGPYTDTNTTYTAASAAPLRLSGDSAVVGTSAKYAREDHRHPRYTQYGESNTTADGYFKLFRISVGSWCNQPFVFKIMRRGATQDINYQLRFTNVNVETTLPTVSSLYNTGEAFDLWVYDNQDKTFDIIVKEPETYFKCSVEFYDAMNLGVTDLKTRLTATEFNNLTASRLTKSTYIGFTSAEKTKLAGIATSANNYSHPTSYGAKTGVPTANATLTHGGTFTVTQPVTDAMGHVTALNTRTYTLPTDNNTTYSAGTGLTLSGTTFGINTTVIPNGTNLNSITTMGFYAQPTSANTSNMTNLPDNTKTAFTMIVQAFTDGGVTQLLTFWSSNRTYVRTGTSSNWNNWVELSKDTNTTYSGATGTSALGLVKISDNYTSSAGNASQSVAASSKAVYDTYNTFAGTGTTKNAHTHTKSQITDFPTSMTPTAHTNATAANIGQATASVFGHVKSGTAVGAADTAAGNAGTDNGLYARADHVHKQSDIYAPKSHSVNANTYGLGTTGVYGHVKIINSVDKTAYADGEALSAYQGKVLKDAIDGKQAAGNYAASSHNHNTWTQYATTWTKNGITVKIHYNENIGIATLRVAGTNTSTSSYTIGTTSAYKPKWQTVYCQCHSASTNTLYIDTNGNIEYKNNTSSKDQTLNGMVTYEYQ